VRLKDKTAIVTGGGRGNGRAIALGFAREGARVAVGDIDMAAAETTAREIRDLGCKSQAIQVDVANWASVEKMAEQAWSDFGRVDILVNNAGVIGRIPFLDISEEEWDRVLDINLKGPFLCSQAVARRMARDGKGGVIINISSVNSEVTVPTTVHYCTSKGGVRTLTKGMAVALAPNKIRVVAIAPTLLLTDMSKERMADPNARAAMEKRIPLGRLEGPEVLVGAAVYLASDEASYVTGSTLFVDGGHLAM